MAARIAVMLLAIPCLALGVQGLHADHRCTTQLHAAEHVRRHDRYAARQVTDQIGEWCTHDTDKAAGIIALGARGHTADALRLARRLVRDAPADYLGWLALSRLEAASRPAQARRDYAHAQRLNPRGLRGPAPSAPPPAGRGHALRPAA